MGALAAAPFVSSRPPSDVRYTELAHPKTHFNLHAWGSLSDWSRRRTQLQRQILAAAGLYPAPYRTPLNVQIVRETGHAGCAIDTIVFEPLPGYYVGANVYRPVQESRRRPGVLIPHGHWKHGRTENLPSYSVPALGINLALQGYVALAWDMAGYNDADQIPHDFGSGWREQLWSFNPLGIQLWTSMRALDYLTSREDVDASLIACTGASGGATQTILLAAVDERVRVSAPVNMISARYQGADPCEEAPGLRIGTNNVEIASLTAPRPMLVVSCTGDWTSDTPLVEYPALQRVWSLYGVLDNVANAHFDAEHNYDRHSREAVYDFLRQHMPASQTATHVDVDPGPVSRSSLLAFSSRPRPESALRLEDLFDVWAAMARSRAASSTREQLRDSLGAALGCQWPDRVSASAVGAHVALTSGGGDRITGRYCAGEGVPTLIVHSKGMWEARQLPEYLTLEEAQRSVLYIDAFGTGAANVTRERGGRWYLSYNATDDAHRVQDILTAARWLQAETGKLPELHGDSRASVWLLLAAAAAPVELRLRVDVSTLKETDEHMREAMFVPGIQHAGGVGAALRVVRAGEMQK